jgi:hypothetical protein
MYFPRNLEFGSALSRLRNNFGGRGGGLNPPNLLPLGTPVRPTLLSLTMIIKGSNLDFWRSLNTLNYAAVILMCVCDVFVRGRRRSRVVSRQVPVGNVS